jgi:hypothetical protein
LNRVVSFQRKSLLGVKATFTSSLSGFGLDKKVDKEQNWKNSSQCNGHVSTELNLKGDSVGGQSLDNGVHSECWRGQSGNGHGGSSLDKGGLGN